MKITTDSLKELLNISNYLDIKIATINRLDYAGNILTVNLNDLLYFRALSDLTLNNCVINSNDLGVLELLNLSKLTFNNCSFIADATTYFKYLDIDTLILDNPEGLNNIKEINARCVILRNMPCLKLVNFVSILDISKAYIIDNMVLTDMQINELVVSPSYLNTHQEFLKNLPFKIKVFDIYSEVAKNG